MKQVHLSPRIGSHAGGTCTQPIAPSRVANTHLDCKRRCRRLISNACRISLFNDDLRPPSASKTSFASLMKPARTHWLPVHTQPYVRCDSIASHASVYCLRLWDTRLDPRDHRGFQCLRHHRPRVSFRLNAAVLSERHAELCRTLCRAFLSEKASHQDVKRRVNLEERSQHNVSSVLIRTTRTYSADYHCPAYLYLICGASGDDERRVTLTSLCAA